MQDNDATSMTHCILTPKNIPTSVLTPKNIAINVLTPKNIAINVLTPKNIASHHESVYFINQCQFGYKPEPLNDIKCNFGVMPGIRGVIQNFCVMPGTT